MKKRVLALIVIIASLLLAGCEGKPVFKTEHRNELSLLIDDLDAQRKRDLEQAPVDASTMIQTVSPYGDYSSMAQWQSRGSKKSILSAQEAREDVVAAFDLLHDLYGGYHYFGGDEVFGPLKESVLSQLYDGERYTIRELKALLQEALSPVLQDGHFAIGGTLLLEERQRMFFVPDVYFDETDGLDSAYVKPTIAPEGKLTYCFAALSKDGEDLPTGIGTYVKLEWTPAEDVQIGAEPVAYHKSEKDGLTFLTCQSMDTYFQEPLLEFARSGAEYQELNSFVIDLRGNRGGSPYYWREWLTGFLGEKPQARETIAIRWPDTSGFYGYLGYITPKTQGSYTINTSVGLWNENERTIFCLIDGQTGSAAEWFAAYLHTLGHVVFIGSNTRGMMLIGGNFTYYLPNSGLDIFFGVGLHFYQDTDNYDGIGQQPDLWVEPAKAADAVTAMWKYYSEGMPAEFKS